MVRVIWKKVASPPHTDGSVVFAGLRHLLHASLNPPEFIFKRHLHRFSCFCTARRRKSLNFAMGRPFTLKISNLHWGSGPPSNTWFFGPTRVHNPNRISIGSAVFAGLTIVTDRQTDWPTDQQPRPGVCPCIRHKTVFYLSGWTGRTGFQHTGTVQIEISQTKWRDARRGLNPSYWLPEDIIMPLCRRDNMIHGQLYVGYIVQGVHSAMFKLLANPLQELISRWDSEHERFYEDIVHVEASAYSHLC